MLPAPRPTLLLLSYRSSVLTQISVTGRPAGAPLYSQSPDHHTPSTKKLLLSCRWNRQRCMKNPRLLLVRKLCKPCQCLLQINPLCPGRGQQRRLLTHCSQVAQMSPNSRSLCQPNAPAPHSSKTVKPVLNQPASPLLLTWMQPPPPPPCLKRTKAQALHLMRLRNVNSLWT